MTVGIFKVQIKQPTVMIRRASFTMTTKWALKPMKSQIKGLNKTLGFWGNEKLLRKLFFVAKMTKQKYL